MDNQKVSTGVQSTQSMSTLNGRLKFTCMNILVKDLSNITNITLTSMDTGELNHWINLLFWVL